MAKTSRRIVTKTSAGFGIIKTDAKKSTKLTIQAKVPHSTATSAHALSR